MLRRFFWLGVALAVAGLVHSFGVRGWVAGAVIGGTLIVLRHKFYGPRSIKRVPGAGGRL